MTFGIFSCKIMRMSSYLKMLEERNPFLSLLKHKPEAGKSSKENFLTEAFVFVLSLENNLLLKHLLKRIYPKKNEIGSRRNEFEIETQFSIKESTLQTKYPDICIHSKDTIILIENKVESGLNYSKGASDRYEPQTKFYEAYLNKSNKPFKKLIIITKYPFEDAGEGINISWYQVYGWIKEYGDSFTQNTGELFKYNVCWFLELLEELDMKPEMILKEDWKVAERWDALNKAMIRAKAHIIDAIVKKYKWEIEENRAGRESEEGPYCYHYWTSKIKSNNKIYFDISFELFQETLKIELDFKKDEGIRPFEGSMIKRKYNDWKDRSYFKRLKMPPSFFKKSPDAQEHLLLKRLSAELDDLTRDKILK